MSEMIDLIKSGALSAERSKSLLEMTKMRLDSYDQALKTMSGVTDENWTYETWQGVLFSVSGERASMTLGEWNAMFPEQRLQLKTTVLNSIQEGKRVFGEIKTMLENQLVKR
jgi:hypothetical protein